MSFWSGEKLKERLPKLICGFDPAMVDCAAYTLTVGPETYVTPDHKTFNPFTHTASQLEEGESIAIPSGQFGFLLTEERVEVPVDAMAFISMKSGIKFKGLINVSGFHVDPGFCGRLIFSVFNAGPSSIHLKRGMPLFLIWYADLDAPTSLGKRNTDQMAIPSTVINGISGEIYSVRGIAEHVRKIDRKVTTVITLFSIIVTLLVAIAADAIWDKGFFPEINIEGNYAAQVSQREESQNTHDYKENTASAEGPVHVRVANPQQ